MLFLPLATANIVNFGVLLNLVAYFDTYNPAPINPQPLAIRQVIQSRGLFAMILELFDSLFTEESFLTLSTFIVTILFEFE